MYETKLIVSDLVLLLFRIHIQFTFKNNIFVMLQLTEHIPVG